MALDHWTLAQPFSEEVGCGSTHQTEPVGSADSTTNGPEDCLISHLQAILAKQRISEASSSHASWDVQQEAPIHRPVRRSVAIVAEVASEDLVLFWAIHVMYRQLVCERRMFRMGDTLAITDMFAC